MSETAQPVDVDIDKAYRFDEFKILDRREVPEAAVDLVERLDEEYAKAPASHFSKITEAIRPQVVEGGAPYAIFQDRDSSTETALVVPLPYCNPIIPDTMEPTMAAEAIRQGHNKAFDSNTWNNGEKHLFLFEMMKALGVRDEAGRTIPVIAVTADSQDYEPNLDRQGKKDLKNGNLGLYVRNVQDILDHTGHGRLHVSGYSQGGSVAHEFLARSHNFDIASAVVAEAPTYKNRPINELALNYLLNKPAPETGTGLDPEVKKIIEAIKWTADGPQSRKDLESIQNRAFVTMARSIALKGAWRAAFGLSHATMAPDLAIAANERGLFPLSISWNETSSLTHDIEPQLFAADSHDKEVFDAFREAGKLRTVKALGHEAVGAPHLAGESPMYYALMIAESVQWAGIT